MTRCLNNCPRILDDDGLDRGGFCEVCFDATLGFYRVVLGFEDWTERDMAAHLNYRHRAGRCEDRMKAWRERNGVDAFEPAPDLEPRPVDFEWSWRPEQTERNREILRLHIAGVPDREIAEQANTTYAAVRAIRQARRFEGFIVSERERRKERIVLRAFADAGGLDELEGLIR